MRTSRWGFVYLAIAVLALLLSDRRPADADAPPPARAESLNIIMTQSLEGELAPCGTCRFPAGGIPRRAVFIQTCRDTADHVLVVDAGNFRYPGEQADFQRDRFQLELQASLGCMVFGIGEKDLQFGVASLRELFAGTGQVPVSANILDAETGEPLFAPYHVLEVGPSRIGCTGFLNPAAWEEFASSHPDVRVGDPLEVMPPVLAALREEEECDLVICFCQMHHHRLRSLLQGIEGIDIAVAARRPVPGNYPRRMPTVEQVFHSGYGGRFICWSRVELYPDRAVVKAGRIHHLVLGMAEDGDLRRRIHAFLGTEDPGDAVGLTPQ